MLLHVQKQVERVQFKTIFFQLAAGNVNDCTGRKGLARWRDVNKRLDELEACETPRYEKKKKKKNERKLRDDSDAGGKSLRWSPMGRVSRSWTRIVPILVDGDRRGRLATRWLVVATRACQQIDLKRLAHPPTHRPSIHPSIYRSMVWRFEERNLSRPGRETCIAFTV